MYYDLGGLQFIFWRSDTFEVYTLKYLLKIKENLTTISARPIFINNANANGKLLEINDKISHSYFGIIIINRNSNAGYDVVKADAETINLAIDKLLDLKIFT